MNHFLYGFIFNFFSKYISGSSLKKIHLVFMEIHRNFYTYRFPCKKFTSENGNLNFSIENFYKIWGYEIIV